MAKKPAPTEALPENIEDIRLEDLPGYDLLIPPYKLRPSQATRLIVMADSAEDDTSKVLAAVEAVEAVAVEDDEAWVEFYAKQGLEAVLTLCAVYLGKVASANN